MGVERQEPFPELHVHQTEHLQGFCGPSSAVVHDHFTEELVCSGRVAPGVFEVPKQEAADTLGNVYSSANAVLALPLDLLTLAGLLLLVVLSAGLLPSVGLLLSTGCLSAGWLSAG